jgi:hypothetical protein
LDVRTGAKYTYRFDLTLQAQMAAICTTSLTFKNLRSAHTVYFCVFIGLRTQRLFPCTT